MKLFHISDLHLGKRIYEFSMLEEQRELLLEILPRNSRRHCSSAVIFTISLCRRQRR